MVWETLAAAQLPLLLTGKDINFKQFHLCFYRQFCMLVKVCVCWRVLAEATTVSLLGH